ncbi:hypothetical protein EPD60_03790 [Flaviaesturariibacter flavus]|uniref:Uncharacterized protein n=1 Tax=Flaviaesturariibacter flavus TaxID=2502780 RepID=A0A4V2NWU0_9BACT|nr:hypothetical protein [Flaviaesturariibacter flavus]TCJ18632.1 hypothetical protein EPD60_03790 [Flaviaesturariibacter flavus]
MTTIQERRFNMMLAVIALCRANPRILDRNLPFKRGFLKLESICANVGTASAGQRVSVESVQAEKKLARASLCDATAIACGQLKAWATETGDAGMSMRSKWTVSTLEKLSDLNLENTCREIIADAELALTRDPEMGITATESLQLKSLLGAFVEKKPVPRNTTARRSSSTATLAQLMTSAGQVLRLQLDKAAVKYKATEPEFYREYKENRKVMDVGVRRDDDHAS